MFARAARMPSGSLVWCTGASSVKGSWAASLWAQAPLKPTQLYSQGYCSSAV